MQDGFLHFLFDKWDMTTHTLRFMLTIGWLEQEVWKWLTRSCFNWGKSFHSKHLVTWDIFLAWKLSIVKVSEWWRSSRQHAFREWSTSSIKFTRNQYTTQRLWVSHWRKVRPQIDRWRSGLFDRWLIITLHCELNKTWFYICCMSAKSAPWKSNWGTLEGSNSSAAISQGDQNMWSLVSI